MTISSDSSKVRWIDLINESVHTSDDIDIGDIDAVSRDFIVVKRGFANVHYYYIPIGKVEGWDSHVVWLTITESEVKADYERDTIPDPARYYVKDYPVYNSAFYPEVVMIQSRYKGQHLQLHHLQKQHIFTSVTFVIYPLEVMRN
jgi:hypothetical protein